MRRNDQSLYTCFQSRVNHRCKKRIVIGRKNAKRDILFRLVIYLSIGPTKEPVHRGGVPLRSKASEVLTRHGRLGLLYGAIREVMAKRFNNSLRRIDIV